MPVPEGYIGFIEEIPGANSQGETLDEVRENLREAVQLVLEANRELAEQTLIGQNVEREPFSNGFVMKRVDLGAADRGRSVKEFLQCVSRGGW